MINNWHEIEKTYNSLNHTSRSSQNLSVWGELFASAYKLNPDKADQMWQNIIDLNVSNDITYAKYFVGQIFKKIVDELHAAKATEFLLMNDQRLELLFLHSFDGGSHYECIYYVLGYFIVSKEYDQMFSLLRLLARKNNTDDFANNASVCNSLYSVLSKLSRDYNGYEEEYNKLSKEEIASVFDLCIQKHRGTLLADGAYIRRCLLMNRAITDSALIHHYLDTLFENEPGLFTDFLYLERNFISNEEVTSYVERYVDKHTSLPIEVSPDAPKAEKKKADWYESFFSKNKSIREGLLLRADSRFYEYEKEYLDSLIKDGDGHAWVRLLASSAVIGDTTRRYSVAGYITSRLSYATAPKVHRDGIFTFTSYSSLEGDELYCNFKDEDRIEFAKLVMVVSYLLDGVDRTDDIARKLDEFIMGNDTVKEYFVSLGYHSSRRADILAERMSEFGKRIVSVTKDWTVVVQTVSALKQKKYEQEKTAEEQRLRSMSSAEGLVDCFLSVSSYKPKKSVFLKEESVYAHYLKILSPIVTALQEHFKKKGSNILSFIGEKSGVRPIYMTDSEGNILRETNMIVDLADVEFCEYTLRYLEALMREKIHFARNEFPQVPSVERPAAIYYSHPNGNKGYYRCKNKDEQKCVLRLDKKIYTHIQNIAQKAVEDYFLQNPQALVQIDALFADKKVKKPIVEEISAIIFHKNYSDELIEKAFSVFENTTPTNKKTKGNTIAHLLLNYWLLNAPLSSKVTYESFAKVFPTLDWDIPYEQEIYNRNYGSALNYFTKNYNLHRNLKESDRTSFNNALIVSLYAIDELCERLSIDRNYIYLGKWGTTTWEECDSENLVTNSGEISAIKNLGNVQIFDRSRKKIKQYTKSQEHSKLLRYIVKAVEMSFLQAKGLPGGNSPTENIDGLLPNDNYRLFTQYLPVLIYQATMLVAVNNLNVNLEQSPSIVKISESHIQIPTNGAKKDSDTTINCEQIAKMAYFYCFGEFPKEATPNKEQYDCFHIDLQKSDYKDYFEPDYISSEAFVQEPNKQVLTRFHTLYDSYCDQLQKVFDIRYLYDPTFSVNYSKLMKKGDGFVGKDLYQFAQIEQDSRDFMQWIARIEKGEIIFPQFQAYIPMLFYYFINEQLYANNKPMALVVMCKIWNHYFDEFTEQDASLLLAWIKDYWMVFCPEIPLSDFKKLFNRKVVFINELQNEVLEGSNQLEYYNEVCFYRVLHGKLVTSGYQSLFEETIDLVNKRLSALWDKYGLSYKNMIYQAAGKNTYLFLRAIVLKDNLYRISSTTPEVRVSELEKYNLVENEKTVRLQWEYAIQDYSSDFIKMFMEYTVKLTEYRLRCWLGLGVNNTFNVDANTIYKFKQHNEKVAKLLRDDMNESHIEKIIYDSVVEVCTKRSVIQRGFFEPFSVVKTANGRARDEFLFDDDFKDYEGIDPTQRVTTSSLEEARRVLHQNQDKLVVEEENETVVQLPVQQDTGFDEDEISFLKILLYSTNVAYDIQRMVMQKIIPDVLITRINEKAMDLYGDILIDETTTPPSIFEDYVELCKGVVDNHE